MNTRERIIESFVNEVDVGSRLDLYLTKRFTYRSRNQWQKIITAGQIIINGKKVKPSTKIVKGNIIRFVLISDNEPEIDANINIVYEDSYLLCVEKSGNLPCHPAGIYFKNTLWYILREKYDNIYFPHRLDRETSGLILLAKDTKMNKEISKLFLNNTIKKEYLLMVHGEMKQNIEAKGYLFNESKNVRKKRSFIIEKDWNEILNLKYKSAQFAQTYFQPIKIKNNKTFVRVILKTGKLHQIRATAYGLGFPVVGDKIYGLDESIFIRFIRGELTQEDENKLEINRQALHSYKLSFIHPIKKELIEIKSKNSYLFKKFISK